MAGAGYCRRQAYLVCYDCNGSSRSCGYSITPQLLLQILLLQIFIVLKVKLLFENLSIGVWGWNPHEIINFFLGGLIGKRKEGMRSKLPAGNSRRVTRLKQLPPQEMVYSYVYSLCLSFVPLISSMGLLTIDPWYTWYMVHGWYKNKLYKG